jgi:hypothetical protein
MKNKIISGNVSIEKVTKGYFLDIADGMTSNRWAITEQEFSDLEACIHQIQIRGWEFTKPKKFKIPDVSAWIREGKDIGYFDYWLNLPENQPIKKKPLTEKLLLNCSICGEKIEGLPVMTDSDLFHRSCYNKQMKPKRKINKKV